MQIRSKLTLQFIVVVATILFVSFVSIYLSSKAYYEEEFFGRLKNKAITSADYLVQSSVIDSVVMLEIQRYQKDLLFNEKITVFDSSLSNQLFTSNDSLMMAMPSSLLIKLRASNEVRIRYGDFHILGLKYHLRDRGYFIVASAVDKFGSSKLANLLQTLIISFLIIIVIIAVSGWIYAGRALKPIISVIEQVKEISPANLSERLKASGNKDEIGTLINIFNELLDRTETAFKLQRSFVANASHELKNPLTIITSQLEVCLLKDRSNEDYKKLIESVLEDIEDLNSVTIKLMELANITHGATIGNFKTLRIDEVLWQSRGDFVRRNKEEYEVIYEIANLPDDESRLYFVGSEPLLKALFINLMQNSCKFSYDNKVRIKLSYVNNRINVHFIDYGPGIPQADLPSIYEPFYRGQSTRTVKGHGIGLSIVNRIAEIHNIEIQIETKIGEGTSFKLLFPASNLSSDI